MQHPVVSARRVSAREGQGWREGERYISKGIYDRHMKALHHDAYISFQRCDVFLLTIKVGLILSLT